jgi:long-subunit fatty acid transport protein
MTLTRRIPMMQHIIGCSLTFLIMACLLAPLAAYGQVAQEIKISGSPNPVGSGARALGMGGAFIGVADDATAASWNPGGLIQLETPEISIVLSYEQRSEERTFQDNPGASGSDSIELTDLNYLSAVYPFAMAGRNMIVSLNYQTLYDFNKEATANYQYNQPFPFPSGQRETRIDSEGYLKALSPAYAIQLTPTFSTGITLNWFSSDLGSGWKRTYTDTLVGTVAGNPISRDIRNEQEYEFDGFNFNLGMTWNIDAKLTLGAVFKTPFDADVHFREVYQKVETNTPSVTNVNADETQTMSMPQSYGIGLAYRFSDEFTIDLDFYRTDWQDYVITQADGREISPITGQDPNLSDTQPTHQIRVGGEYLFIRKNSVIPVRAGLFYDPEPTANSPDDFYGISIGSGIAKGRIVFDAAYQYRWGNDVRMVRLGTEEVEQDVQQHTIYMSLIYHF